MTDIVERLKEEVRLSGEIQSYENDINLYEEAAAEIARLRTAVERAQAQIAELEEVLHVEYVNRPPED